MKIAIMTSGGDCAGLNTVIRSVVVRAQQQYGWAVHGIKKGVWGLLQDGKDAVEELEFTYWNKQGMMLERGGTALGSTVKYLPKEEDALQGMCDRAVGILKQEGFDALILVGGDVSLAVAQRLMRAGMPIIGIPKTIDNDVVNTQSVGFLSAVQVGVDALDNLRTTAMSHSRVFVLEIMGRDAGYLPLSVAIAGGADVALIPEIPYSRQIVTDVVKERLERDGYVLVVTSEAAYAQDASASSVTQKDGLQLYRGAADLLADELSHHVPASVRAVRLGHIQRGGGPVAYDRLLGCRQGIAAVDALADGQKNIVVAWDGLKVFHMPLEEIHVAQMHKDHDLIQTALGMDMCLGC